jgi:hypothetical protein
MLKIDHNAGFFSCCTIRLSKIIEYFNNNQKLPEEVDSSQQFNFYKSKQCDITFQIFENYNNVNQMITYNSPIEMVYEKTENQFSDYSKLNFEKVVPFVKKYFTPSDSIIQIQKFLEYKYQIDYDNTCAIFYRGNDKAKETNQPPYQEVIDKAKIIQNEFPNIRFLIQTDETEFLNYALQNLNNSFEIKELQKINQNKNLSIQYVLNNDQKLLGLSLYFATILIISKCRKIIHTSGNGEMFMIFYRGNVNGCYQYLNEKDYIYGVKNDSYNPNKNNHWLTRE